MKKAQRKAKTQFSSFVFNSSWNQGNVLIDSWNFYFKIISIQKPLIPSK